MNLQEGFEYLKKNGIPTVDYSLVESADDLKFPCVLKANLDVSSHKTELGAVQIVYDEKSALEFLKRFKDVGVISQPLVKGIELIVGKHRDKQFGEIITFGVGGTLVELLNDVSIRVCPITKHDVKSMIQDLKLSKLITGYRGMCANADLLSKVVVKMCKLDFDEIEINPLFAGPDFVLAADVRII